MHWWNWSDPSFTLAFIAVVGGVLGGLVVPVFLFRATRTGQKLGQEAIEGQRQILAAQRRDQLLATLPEVSERTTFETLRKEVGQYQGEDRRLLLRALRQNPLEPLPYWIEDAEQVGDFVASLERRYQVPERGDPFAAIQAFLRALPRELAEQYQSDLVKVLTGDAALAQHPGHMFYRDLVSRGCWYLAAPLLHGCKDLSSYEHGGLKLNVLTGVLMGINDLHCSRVGEGVDDLFGFRVADMRPPLVRPDDWNEFARGVQVVLATLLHRRDLSDLNSWSLTGSTEPASATVAWLILVVGRNSGIEHHIDMRCMEHLAEVVRSIPPRDAGWGTDVAFVKEGLTLLQTRRPQLWAEYGRELEEVTAVKVDAADLESQ